MNNSNMQLESQEDWRGKEIKLSVGACKSSKISICVTVFVDSWLSLDFTRPDSE